MSANTDAKSRPFTKAMVSQYEKTGEKLEEGSLRSVGAQEQKVTMILMHAANKCPVAIGMSCISDSY